MAYRARSRHNRSIRNLQSFANTSANVGIRATSKATVGIFKWAATDHSHLGSALKHMPDMGFEDTLSYLIRHLLYLVIAAVISGGLFFILFAFVVPFFLFGGLE